MALYADLHIHSRYSRATSAALNPASLSLWAARKGLGLIGTGDLTHPAWLQELKSSLRRRDDGFYSLAEEPEGIRFVPTGEVSAIYKHDGRTRKIHLVIIAPHLEAAERFSKHLGSLGNIHSDGRPILGLAARDILELALQTDENMQVVPAHIWTPWFSLFGANSGYDRLEDCFGDLSGHISALETGLSSDPAMNRLVSALDPYALISSSDAHSPDKLGREATILKGELSWPALVSALHGGPELGGTVEFFPEEGKYHLDGHASCGPPLSPQESRALGGICPVCGKALTTGVLHRVLDLADRAEPGEGRLPDYHLIPLAELLGQVLGQGPKSKKVTEAYLRLTRDFGSEYGLLLEAELDDIELAAGPLLRLAVQRMRLGQIEAAGGYDGLYGTVTAVSPAERLELGGQGRLFELAPPRRPSPKLKAAAPPSPKEAEAAAVELPSAPEPLALQRGDLLVGGLDEAQAAAVTCLSPVLSVLAGPGSGKTRVLVHRAAWLLREGLVEGSRTLICAFTRQAAEELSLRLAAALPFRQEAAAVRVRTLHGLALELLRARRPDWALAEPDYLAELCKKCGRKIGLKGPAFAALLGRVKNGLSLRPGETDLPPEAPEGFSSAYAQYQKLLTRQKLWDFDDLILEAEPDEADELRAVLVDEFQDLTPAQFAFLKRLCPPALFKESSGRFLTLIGDPDQSIYGFRGARADIFQWLKIYPSLKSVELETNYRSCGHIIRAGEAVLERLGRGRRCGRGQAGALITRASLGSAKSEAAYVVRRMAAHLGLLKLGLENSARQDAELIAGLALSDIAVLFRLRSLGQAVAEELDRAGLAWQMSGQDPLTATDGLDFTADKVSLLTMHAAKGLEFKLVFVLGAQKGLCPYLAPGETASAERLAEERRLFYVALTRAKDKLYLCRAPRRLYGQTLDGEASEFWLSLGSGLCRDERPARILGGRRQKSAPSLFD